MKPFVTAVADYHDLLDVARHFRNAGFHLDYTEVGCGNSKFWRGSNAGYHAVFYENRAEAESLIKEWTITLKKECDFESA